MKGKKKINLAIPGMFLAAVLVLFPLAGPRAARAQGFDLTVSPVKKEITLRPGESLDFDITLINHAEKDQELLVYAMDFFIHPDGSYEFQEPGYYTYSCSRWLSISRERLVIPARTQQQEIFRIQVPPDAEPGGHFSVLFFQDATQPPPGMGVKPTYRIGSLILVTIPGDIVRQAEIRNFSVESDFLSLWGPPAEGEAGWPTRDIRYHLEVENTGNVHLTVQVFIDYRSRVGFGSGTVDLGEITVLPGTRRELNGRLPSPPSLGWFKAEAVIRYGPDLATFDTEKRRSTGFWVLPLLWILAAAVLAAGAWLLARFLKRKVKISLRVDRRR